jgi:hypothetical protein
MREPNLEKLNALVGKLVGDLGTSLGGASILLGDRLGLYKAMADGAVVTPFELAKNTGLHERYVREWLSGQAASGYIDYHPEKNAFSLSAEQAMAFAEEGSPAFFAGAGDEILDNGFESKLSRPGLRATTLGSSHLRKAGTPKFLRKEKRPSA